MDRMNRKKVRKVRTGRKLLRKAKLKKSAVTSDNER